MLIDIYCIIFIICITRVISYNHWLNETNRTFSNEDTFRKKSRVKFLLNSQRHSLNHRGLKNMGNVDAC